MRFRVVTNEEIVIVRVNATIESDVRSIVTSATDGRVLITKVAAAHVVIGRIDETVFRTRERLTFIRIKEGLARVCHEHLRIERRHLIYARHGIKPTQFVVLVDKTPVRPEKANE